MNEKGWKSLVKSRHTDLGASRVKIQDHQREAAKARPALQEPRALTTEGASWATGFLSREVRGGAMRCGRMSHFVGL